MSAFPALCSSQKAAALKDQAFDRAAPTTGSTGYGCLDELLFDLLMGVR